jgi:DNA-binding response OmpR family regulator
MHGERIWVASTLAQGWTFRMELPVLDGLRRDAADQALPGLTAVPIIAVSSFAMKRDEEKAGAAGCEHYVTQPYSPVHLLRIIRGFLGESREVRPHPIAGLPWNQRRSDHKTFLAKLFEKPVEPVARRPCLVTKRQFIVFRRTLSNELARRRSVVSNSPR